jgi:hypothetical protein
MGSFVGLLVWLSDAGNGGGRAALGPDLRRLALRGMIA